MASWAQNLRSNMTGYERRSALVGSVLLVAIAVTYALTFDVRGRDDTMHGLALLLGVTYITGYLRIILPRRMGVTTFNIREASYSIALIGGEPRFVIPALLVFRLHQWWLTGINTKWRLLTAATGLETILLEVWLFDHLGVLAAPENVTPKTILLAAPVLAVGAIASFLVFSLVHPLRSVKVTATSVPPRVIVSVSLMSWAAAMLGMLIFLPDTNRTTQVLVSGGPLLLALVVAVSLQQFNRSRHWSEGSTAVHDWEMTPARALRVLRHLRRLSSLSSQILLIEDRTTGTTLRAWLSLTGRRAGAERINQPLHEVLNACPGSQSQAHGYEEWNPTGARGWMIMDTTMQRVALLQIAPPVRVQILPAPPQATAAVSMTLPAESLLRSLAQEVYRYETDQLSTPGLSSMLQNLTEGFAVVGVDRRVRSWNRALERMTGLSESEVAGSVIDDHITPSSTKISGIGPALMTVRRSDGSRVFLQTSLAELECSDETTTVYTFRDVTETVAVAESRSQFFAYVAHELKSPITSLYLQSDELEERLGVDDPLVESVQYAVDQLSSHLADMSTASEMTLAQSEAAVPTKQHSLPASELLRFPWLDKTLAIDGRITVQEVEDFNGIVDVFRSHQILTNLVSNAVKYSGATDTIDLFYGVHPDGQRGYFSVADTGIGVPKEARNRVFEPYFRASNVGDLPGSGLGLSLSRQLARQMGGELTYEPGNDGSTFTFWVPLDDQSETENQLTGQADSHT